MVLVFASDVDSIVIMLKYYSFKSESRVAGIQYTNVWNSTKEALTKRANLTLFTQ